VEMCRPRVGEANLAVFRMYSPLTSHGYSKSVKAVRRQRNLGLTRIYISYYFIVRLKQNNKIITKIFFHLVSFGCLCIDWSLPLPWFLCNPSGFVDDWIGSIGWCYINAAWSGWWHIRVQELNKTNVHKCISFSSVRWFHIVVLFMMFLGVFFMCFGGVFVCFGCLVVFLGKSMDREQGP
jgi:hypothetical protein